VSAADQHPEPGVEYGAFPTGEYRAARGWEAAQTLAKFLDVPVVEARALLVSGGAGPAIEARRADPAVARRLLERRFLDPSARFR
jgi:hypothetical protein